MPTETKIDKTAEPQKEFVPRKLTTYGIEL